jgi:hypothetical protein
MKKIRVVILALLLMTPSLFGGFLLAQDPPSSEMPEETKVILCNTKLVDGQFTDPCNFEHFVELGRRIINLAIYLAIPLAALSFAWAGFTILTAGGNMGQRDKGKKIFTKVAIGLFWVLAAWLVINTILSALLKDGYSPLS